MLETRFKGVLEMTAASVDAMTHLSKHTRYRSCCCESCTQRFAETDRLKLQDHGTFLD